MRKAAVGIGVLLVVVGLIVLKTMYDAGNFKRIAPHFAGSCRLVRGPVGSEDLVISAVDGNAYISACDRRALRGKARPGAIFRYSLGDEKPVPINLTPTAGIEFQPHGVSLWTAPDGSQTLFVVNHPAAASGKPKHTIEIFDIRDGALVHRRSVTDPELLVMPNDIVGVAADRFYLTNTHANPPGEAQQLETYLRRAQAKVLYFDGERFRVALDQMLFPNGINISRDGTRLYIASTTGRELLVYRRDPATEQLEPDGRLFIGSGLDNIDVDPAGNLWIGAHPQLMATAKLSGDPKALSPSQVVRIPPSLDRFDEIYLDDGRQLSGSSVGAALGNRLLIGQIFDDGFLDCAMDD